MHTQTEPEAGITRILIIGGGFGGIQAALDLEKMRLPNTHITLISNKHHFEYPPTFYKLAAGIFPTEKCIPLADIFPEGTVEIVIDTITGGDTAQKTITGESGATYHYDYVVLALGSEVAYFDIPGIQEHSYSLKTVADAISLKAHIHELFNTHHGMSAPDLMAQFQFIIVGGGPSGVELAGVLRGYLRALAEVHHVPMKFITVDILQAAPRLLPTFPERVSALAARQLDRLGVNLLLGSAVAKEDQIGVYMKDLSLHAKTIIWTAGVRAHSLYGKITGLTLEKNGRVTVSETLEAIGTTNVFIVGDGANTLHAGTAQTAIADGHFAAKVIRAKIENKKIPTYIAKQTPYVVPIGFDWAIFTYKNTVITGKLIFWLRELVDLHYFLTILPWWKAFRAWKRGGIRPEVCETCGH